MEKPKDLNQIWPERDLSARLGLPTGSKSGRSRQLSHWIKGGLRYFEKSGNRYFFEQDVIEYAWKRYTDKYGQ